MKTKTGREISFIANIDTANEEVVRLEDQIDQLKAEVADLKLKDAKPTTAQATQPVTPTTPAAVEGVKVSGLQRAIIANQKLQAK